MASPLHLTFFLSGIFSTISSSLSNYICQNGQWSGAAYQSAFLRRVMTFDFFPSLDTLPLYLLTLMILPSVVKHYLHTSSADIETSFTRTMSLIRIKTRALCLYFLCISVLSSSSYPIPSYWCWATLSSRVKALMNQSFSSFNIT